MAKIFPERLPTSVLEDARRGAERKLYVALKSLSKAYTIYYSVHWQSDPSKRGIGEGEADFVIVHPEKGVVVIEVKGGSIRFDAVNNQWYSRAASDQEYEIKDPVDQVSRNHHELEKQLKRLPGWGDRFINFGHAVCFPDVFLQGKGRLKPDLPRELILDHDDLEEIDSAIDRLFNSLFGDNISIYFLGQTRTQILEKYLANSFEITTPLGVELEYEEEKLIQLTETQFITYMMMLDRKRAAIGGCAGSGKTLLAVRKAQQMSSLGLKVLLVCFNAPLAEYLRTRVRDVDVYHFHDLCKHAANTIGYTVNHNQTDQEFYEIMLPQALMDAAQEIGRIYDAIIVDEGQDFKESYWIALESILKEDGNWFVFFDNNQDLYGGSPDFGGLIPELPLHLNINCRNTKAIHQTVAHFHNNPSGLISIGPDGRQPEKISYRGADNQLKTLQRLLHRLIHDDRIHCDDIVILTPRSEDKTVLKGGTRLGMFTLRPFEAHQSTAIFVTSVHKFKGLERRVVILTEIDDRHPEYLNMIFYVGCSRARTHLIILYDENTPVEFVERI